MRTTTPKFTKSPSLVLISLVMTEIQPFINVKIDKETYGTYGASDAVFGELPDDHTFLSKLRHFQMAVSCILLDAFTPNLGIL